MHLCCVDVLPVQANPTVRNPPVIASTASPFPLPIAQALGFGDAQAPYVRLAPSPPAGGGKDGDAQ